MIGKIEFEIESLQTKADLYQIENEHKKYYLGLKDMTTSKSSYGTGRFIPIIKENDQFFVDFNLAFTPVCGHLSSSKDKLIACPMFRDSISFIIEAGEKIHPH